MFYFVRVNGKTLHNDPSSPNFFVPGEPPQFPTTEFNALRFCLERGIVRIGWPDTGDLRKPSKSGALAHGYSLESLKPSVQRYLRTFRDVRVDSIILMPDTDNPGDFYMGQVTEPYHYVHDVPQEPYEYAHRLGVDWDKAAGGRFVVYRAAELGIEVRGGGFWRRAFRSLHEYERSRQVIPALEAARARR